MKTPLTIKSTGIACFFTAVLISVFALRTAAQNSFKKQYRDSTVNSVYTAMMVDEDCNIVVGGNNASGNSNSSKQYGLLSKFSSEGNLIWNKILPFRYNVNYIFPVDGGYVIIASNDAGLNFIKTDKNGNIITARGVGGPYSSLNTVECIQTKDKNYVLRWDLGEGTGAWHPFLEKFDAEFNIVWLKSYNTFVYPDDFNHWCFIDGLREGPDGNLLISGQYDGMGLISKIDQSNGIPLWSKRIGYADTINGGGPLANCQALINNTLYVAFNNMGMDTSFVGAFDVNGTAKWFKKYKGVCMKSIIKTSDKQLAVVCNYYKDTYSTIIKIDTSGNIAWTSSLNLTFLTSIAAGTDGGIYAAGSSPIAPSLFNNAYFNALLLKTDAAGALSCANTLSIPVTDITTQLLPFIMPQFDYHDTIVAFNIATRDLSLNDSTYCSTGVFTSCTATGTDEVIVSGISVYPNPVADELIIHSVTELESIKLYSVSGELIMVNQVRNKGYVKLDISSLAPGIYFLQTTSGSKTITQKVIKM